MMKKYMPRTPEVDAVQMSLGMFHTQVGTQIQDGIDPDQEGMAVHLYTLPAQEGGEPENFLLWQPMSVFNEIYDIVEEDPTKNMSFAKALDALYKGHAVQRRVWGDRFISLSSLAPMIVPSDKLWSPHNREIANQNGGVAEVQPSIVECNLDAKITMGWTPTQQDMLADDWEQV